jgi:hypothetical protein
MLDELLQEHGSELIAAITKGSELDAGEAKQLLPPAVGQISEVLQGGGGGIDLGALLGGSGGAVSSLLENLDVAQIANAAGIDRARAEGGLASLIPVVVSLLGEKSGGLDGLLSMLGGDGGSGPDLGALGGIAGKLFGK